MMIDRQMSMSVIIMFDVGFSTSIFARVRVFERILMPNLRYRDAIVSALAINIMIKDSRW